MKVSKKADVRAAVVALAGAATALVLFLGGTAFAHAAYESSDPPDGGTVSSPPSQVTAEFTEPLQVDSYMDVTDPCGRDVGGDTSIAADTMIVSMSGSAEGEYVVSWRAHSSVDNHITTGSFSFTSTGGDPCPGEEPEPEEKQPKKESSGSAGNNSSSAGTGSGGSSTSGNNNKSSTGGGGNDGSRARNETRNENGAGRGASEDDVKGNTVAAAPEEERDRPSTLEGIPVGGLITTLVLAALIGAAAGKIYFSLSGEGG